MILSALILGGVVSVGAKLYEHWTTSREAAKAEGASEGPEADVTASGDEASDEVPSPGEEIITEREVDQRFAISVAGLACAVGGTFVYPPATIVSLGCVGYNLIGLGGIIAARVAKERKLPIEVMDLGAIVIGIVAKMFVLNSLAECIYFGGLKLRIQTKNRLRNKIVKVFKEQPTAVWLVKDDVEVLVPLMEVRLHDILVVGAGELVAVDGKIVEGTAAVDQRFLTGEAQLAEKGVGDEVLASTFIVRGRVKIRVEKTGAATAASQIESVINSTTTFEDSLTTRSESISDATVLPTFGLGLLGLGLRGLTGLEGVVTSNFSVVYRLASPWMMLNYTEGAAQDGVIIKDGRSLELIPRVDTVVFDKTGTLTLGDFKLGEIHALGDVSEGELLRLSASCEQRQSHPIAKAILHAAEERGIPLSPINDVHYELGHGVKAHLGDETVLVGSERFMRNQGVTLPEHIQDLLPKGEAMGNSFVHVASGGRLIGLLELCPAIRPEAKEQIARMRERGLSVRILSGDHVSPTRALAESLGIEHYYAETRPEDKARIIEELQAEGRSVCFVGDGINDAIALRKATLSVSMRGASAAAVDSAQVTLVDGTLKRLDDLFELGRAHERSQRAGLALSFGPGAACTAGVLFFQMGVPAAMTWYVVSTAVGSAVALLPRITRQVKSAGTAPETADTPVV
ncbi:heavy metal translocating P-type ATPase [Chondromyces crocatus]|uniref:P-type Zn(2+) transporter n=1 Tax=Chondromyces crocatus TaxID=52 RepID=A0A0K1ECG7_CHOCO|nr:heavy metal translocating P-type ATPase [Chondromyces crocatus]AKT38554.1 uncharacterized protein CMC5_027010 [Chondromyces crocatus]